MTGPAPWSGRLPWDDPGFSERMLAEHLSQQHDLASRRLPTIDEHVAWIHEEVLDGEPSDVVDLCCGPGLYTHRLAALGHTCTGIDFSPAAIRHARRIAERDGVACAYRREDVLEADTGVGRDLVMLLFGDLDTFPPDDAARVLASAGRALDPGGTLLLEVHVRAVVEAMGTAPPGREEVAAGLFSPEPHTLDTSGWWDPETGIAVRRFRVTAPPAAAVDHIVTTQARDAAGYAPMLEAAGFESPARYESFGSAADPAFVVLASRRR